MTQTLRLRRWQKRALEAFDARPGADFLAVATPGAGKTTFALAAARRSLSAGQARRVIVVTPTSHLKHQWADAAAGLGLHLESEWSTRGRLPADMHGVIVTYQQLSSSAAALRGLAEGSFAIFDEIHHAGDERAWGDAVRVAFEPAVCRLSLSGTPFRSDTAAIPFIRYVDDEARADFEYGYGDALIDGRVVRPVYFPRVDGLMEWTAADGTLYSHTFADPLAAAQVGQRLRTALSPTGDWLPAILVRAHQQLLALRAEEPGAGGLIIATDREHARAIAALLRERTGVRPVVATSDDPKASDAIARFAAGDAPWIVAVRMVSEGVDIPRLRVGVYATTTTTELFFRQAVGRLVRWTRPPTPTDDNAAHIFIPDDVRLRTWALGIAQQRTHSLKRKEQDEATELEAARFDDRDAAAAAEEPAGEPQMSLFAPISATVLDEEAAVLAPVGPHRVDPGADEHDPSLEISLGPAPPLPGGAAVGDGTDGVARREVRRRLRERNTDRTRDLAQRTGLTHAKINAELNKLAGIETVRGSTIEQLERRLKAADTWIQTLRGATTRPPRVP